MHIAALVAVALSVQGAPQQPIQYFSAPARCADLLVLFTCYQPCAPDNKPWHDAQTGGGANDVRGIPLRWGIVAGNQRKQPDGTRMWNYGDRVYVGAPLWQVFEVKDDFAAEHPKNRLDLCCYTPSQYLYWGNLAAMQQPVQVWILRKGECVKK